MVNNTINRNTSISVTVPIDDESTRKKKFLMRLLTALHIAGNLSYRTEKDVEKVSQKYDMHSTCVVFPVSAILSITTMSASTPLANESYMFRIKSGLNCSKLHSLNQLCFNILKRDLDLTSAEEQLDIIDNTGPLYPYYVMAAAYGTASFAATTLFFHGNWRDGAWAFVLGLVVWGCGVLSANLEGLAEIECFFSSFIVTLIACGLDKYVYDGQLCLYGQLFGGIVWLLPGITITISLLEIFSNMIVYGTSRLMYGIFLACQLGFGLSAGIRLIYPHVEIPDSFENGCRESVNEWYYLILLPMASLAFCILIGAEKHQLPGMIMIAAFAQAVSFVLTYNTAEGDTMSVPLIGGIVVTLVARVYAHFAGNLRPLIYIISGLLILVPGGIGVKGMSNVWSGDVTTGLEFTFNMVMIGVCLAIGVFLSLLPRKSWTLAMRNTLNRVSFTFIHEKYVTAETETETTKVGLLDLDCEEGNTTED